ncbi:hypothetical protein BCV71DRAFT_240283 [Rhizopus microsporus]|uniref:Uncharacterized protein n=1 Tax=Rhizopus microsporus TaxID=58291 RepID=A0A1X0RJX3_RHIZD|nr:hypothetical protein BCV71DRAFT_240283 [Rhizopus microsporus]
MYENNKTFYAKRILRKHNSSKNQWFDKLKILQKRVYREAFALKDAVKISKVIDKETHFCYYDVNFLSFSKHQLCLDATDVAIRLLVMSFSGSECIFFCYREVRASTVFKNEKDVFIGKDFKLLIPYFKSIRLFILLKIRSFCGTVPLVNVKGKPLSRLRNSVIL